MSSSRTKEEKAGSTIDQVPGLGQGKRQEIFTRQGHGWWLVGGGKEHSKETGGQSGIFLGGVLGVLLKNPFREKQGACGLATGCFREGK